MPTNRIYHNVIPLFSVAILHDYHLRAWFVDGSNNLTEDTARQPVLEAQYNLSEIMRVVPDQATAQALRNHGLYFKTNQQGFYIGVDAREDSGQWQPTKPIPHDLKFRFELQPRDSFWTLYNDLPLNGIGQSQHTIDGRVQDFRNVYYFSNTKGNYPHLTKNGVLNQSNLDLTEDVRSTFDLSLGIDSIGAIEISAYVSAGASENLIENGVLNTQLVNGTWQHPAFRLEVGSRSLVWRYLDSGGSESDRTTQPLPFSMIQINPIPLVQAGGQQERPNPRPGNINLDSTNQQYVAEVYL